MKTRLLITLTLIAVFFVQQNPCYAAFPIKYQNISSSTQKVSDKTNRHFLTQAPDNDKKDKKHKKDQGVTAMVLGIVGIFTMPLGFVCSILAIVFGSQSLKGENRSMAKTGLILGIVGVAIGLLYILLILFSIGIFSLA